MTEQNSPDSCAGPIVLNEFMNTLQRLFKIGIYYPSGHVILDKATARFTHQLVTLAGDNLSVTLKEQGNSLSLEGVVLDPGLPFVQEFKAMLTALGISAITIDRDITAEELHVFIREMRSYSSRVINAKQFAQIEVADLPPSITISLKEFLARNNGSRRQDGSTEDADGISEFLDSLTKFGLNGEEISQCRSLLESLPNRLADSNIEINDLPYASWDDVARLLARAVAGTRNPSFDGKPHQSTQANINALASILQKLERQTTDVKTRETINLFVSIIKKPLPTEDKTSWQDAQKRKFPEKPEISISKLQQFATKKGLRPKILANIPQLSSDNETLSILMQLAQYDQPVQNQIRMQQLFREILSTEISEVAWGILSSSLQQIVADENTMHISAIINMLVEPLRRSRHGNSLRLFQLTIHLSNDREKRILWPYIVNEILVEGGNKDQTAFLHLCAFAASYSQEEMNAALPELQVLDAFVNKTIAADFFHTVSPHSYSLFAFLLKTEVEQIIGERVLTGFKRNAPDWLIGALIPLLDLSRQDHKLFLYSYLRLASQKVIPLSLKIVGANIACDTLAALPKERRSEKWVQETIGLLAQLPKEKIQVLLEQIIGSKKLFVFADWPTECRKAAAKAMMTLQHQK